MSIHHRILPLLITLSACAGTTGAAQTSARFSAIETWADASKSLLDDDMDPGTFAASEVGGADAIDAKLASQRIDVSEGVIVAKNVETSHEVSSSVERYDLHFSIEQQLAGPRFTDPEFQMQISSATPVFASVKSLDQRMIGVRLIIFFKRYRDPDGNVITHFHFAAASTKSIETIKQIVSFK
jgi:hypothetical protein